MFSKLSRSETIERYGLCGGELMPAQDWIAYEEYEGELGVDDPDAWADYSDE